MANMSYCRFRNTLHDVRDCLNTLNDYLESDCDEVEISKEEMAAAHQFLSDVADFLVQNNIIPYGKDYCSEIISMIKCRGED